MVLDEGRGGGFLQFTVMLGHSDLPNFLSYDISGLTPEAIKAIAKGTGLDQFSV